MNINFSMLILPILRPGRGNKSINIAGLLKKLILKLRKHLKHTAIIVRGDSHFCSHDFMDRATDRQDNIHFITGLAGNVKLQKISAGWLDSAVASYKANGGKDVRTFHSFLYKAKSWRHQQRVVVKTEVNALGTNVRYVVTDFKGQRSSAAYVLMHAFQEDMLTGTELENSTISTMRDKLLLNAVSIDEKKTCIRLRFSQKAPMMPEMIQVLTRLQHLPPS